MSATEANTGMTTQRVLMTPELAAELLRRNTQNRSIRHALVKAMASSMASGRWRDNGETIKTDVDGNLLDGQHRLSAVVLSDTPVWLLVVSGLDRDVFTTIDTGRARSNADTLTYLGVPNATKVSAALSAVHAYLSGSMTFTGWPAPDNDGIQALMTRYPGIIDSVHWCQPVSRVCGHGTIAVACHYLFSMVNGEEADVFMKDLVTGSMLESGDPVLRLRDRLSLDKTSNARLGRGVMFAFFVKTWNSRRAGRTIALLRVRTRGHMRETFPAISGLSRAGDV